MKKLLAVLAAFMLVLFSTFFTAKNAVPAFADTEKNEKTIYLTFDDGPCDRVTPKVLNVLKEKEVPATFFVVGNHILSRGSIIKRIVDEGHSVGIHSYSHEYNKIYESTTSLLADIEKCADILKTLDVYTALYRFPGGGNFAGEKYRRAVADEGYKIIEWNAVCGDCEGSVTAKQIYQRAVSFVDCANPIVMLMHDSTDKLCVAQALPYIIDFYRSEGYTFSRFTMCD